MHFFGRMDVMSLHKISPSGVEGLVGVFWILAGFYLLMVAFSIRTL
jgi:hypothetical protein